MQRLQKSSANKARQKLALSRLLPLFFLKSLRCHLGSQRSGSGLGPGFSGSKPFGSRGFFFFLFFSFTAPLARSTSEGRFLTPPLLLPALAMHAFQLHSTYSQASSAIFFFFFFFATPLARSTTKGRFLAMPLLSLHALEEGEVVLFNVLQPANKAIAWRCMRDTCIHLLHTATGCHAVK